MIGQTLWTEFFANRDWPVASAVAIVLLVPAGRADRALSAAVADARAAGLRGAEQLHAQGPSWFNVVSVALGLAFLYLPIAILVIYSFNASRLVTVWGGLSTRWYAALLDDDAMLDVRLDQPAHRAALSATAATVLGTLAAIALVRFGRFRGRTLFSGMIYAPLVMPEVITGLSLLLLFVALGIDRGFWTVTIAHTTLTMCFVAVVVQSRLLGLRPQPGGSRDGSRLPAAADLLCRDPAADRAGDRGRLDAGLHAVARRSGDRELHHRARARPRCRSGSIQRCGSA